jgi:alpha-tubulin suppressor-like RCC1 family protein
MKGSYCLTRFGLLVVVTLLTYPALPGHTANNIVAWGSNNGGLTNPPASLTNSLAVAAGGNGIALNKDHTVVTWGWKDIFDLGPVTNTVPAGLTNVIGIAAGSTFNLALKDDGSVVTWLVVPIGSVGNPPIWSNVVQVSSGNYHTLALLSDGHVVGWGSNEHGEIDVPQDLTNAVTVSAGSQFSLALRRNGEVVAWGRNDLGQTNVPTALTNAVTIAAGHSHGLATTTSGQAIAWGYNSYGVTNVPPSLTDVVAVDAGTGHSLALRRDGTVIAWGQNNAGQTNVPAGLTNVAAIAASINHNLALVDANSAQFSMVLLNPVRSNGIFSATVPTRSGRVYVLEFKDDLAESDWKALPLMAGNGGLRTLKDPNPTGVQRFYRVRQW